MPELKRKPLTTTRLYRAVGEWQKYARSIETVHYSARGDHQLLSSDKQIIYIGELDTAATKHWYRHAQATLFPIRWGEPFGLVLIESMASGTPVLAFGEGSVPEIVKHGETGFVVDSVEAMVQAVGRIEQINRWNCRRHVKTYFSIQRMAEGYAALYEQLAPRPVFSSVGQPLALKVPLRQWHLTP